MLRAKVLFQHWGGGHIIFARSTQEIFKVKHFISCILIFYAPLCAFSPSIYGENVFIYVTEHYSEKGHSALLIPLVLVACVKYMLMLILKILE